MNLKELEKEFRAEPKANREDIYGVVTHIAVHCKNCKVLQGKKFHYDTPEGQKLVDRFAWELGNSGEVTDFISRLLSGNVKGKMREVAEKYKGHHVNYRCKEAEELITKVYERFTKIITEPSQNLNI
jgi:hypothetical protein